MAQEQAQVWITQKLTSEIDKRAFAKIKKLTKEKKKELLIEYIWEFLPFLKGRESTQQYQWGLQYCEEIVLQKQARKCHELLPSLLTLLRSWEATLGSWCSSIFGDKVIERALCSSLNPLLLPISYLSPFLTLEIKSKKTQDVRTYVMSFSCQINIDGHLLGPYLTRGLKFLDEWWFNRCQSEVKFLVAFHQTGGAHVTDLAEPLSSFSNYYSFHQ